MTEGQFDPIDDEVHFPEPSSIYYVQDISLGYAEVGGFCEEGMTKETTVAITIAAAQDPGDGAGVRPAPLMSLVFKPQTLGRLLMGIMGTSWHLTHQEYGDQADIFRHAFWHAYLATGQEAVVAWNWLCQPLSQHLQLDDGHQIFRCAACRFVSGGSDHCLICGSRSVWDPETAPESPADGPAAPSATDHTGDTPEARQ